MDRPARTPRQSNRPVKPPKPEPATDDPPRREPDLPGQLYLFNEATACITVNQATS